MKVQRPGLAQQLAIDILILRSSARAIRRGMRWFCATAVDPVDVVDAWARTFWDELDYLKEGQSSEHMRGALTKVRGLVIPRVNWDLTSLRVLTTEWIDGEKITENPKCVTTEHIRIGVETFASMILTVGRVHADPHSGNMLVTEGGRSVCLLDFGMVIDVPAEHRGAWARAVVHLVQKEHEAVLNDLIDIGFFPPDCPKDEILPVMSKIWDQLVDCGSDIHKRKQAVELLYSEILTLVRRFEFGMPDYYVALARALVTIEGVALAADCDFDIFQAIFPVCLRFLASQGATTSVALVSASASALASAFGSKLGSAFDAATGAVLSREPHWSTTAIALVGLGSWLFVQAAALAPDAVLMA